MNVADGVLVGGKHYLLLPPHDTEQVYNLLNITRTDTLNLAGVYFRSVYMPSHGYDGMLYRVGEHCIVTNNGGEWVPIQIAKLFSVNVGGMYRMFCEGHVYEKVVIESEEVIHTYSESSVVQRTENATTLFQVSSIVRKVVLYSHSSVCDEEQFIVIDYCRRTIPLSAEGVIVSFYPLKDDMVTVRGENGELWLAHVQSTDEKSKTCQVYFYIAESDKKYKREVKKLECVSWNTMKDLAEGTWCGKYWVLP